MDIEKKKSGAPWSYGITLVIISFMAATLGFVYFALHQEVDLVETQYYEKSVRFDSVMASRASGMEKEGISLSFPPDSIVVQADSSFHAESLVLSAYRPSGSAADQTIDIVPDSNGRFALPADRFQPGFWRFTLSWVRNGAAASREYQWTRP